MFINIHILFYPQADDKSGRPLPPSPSAPPPLPPRNSRRKTISHYQNTGGLAHKHRHGNRASSSTQVCAICHNQVSMVTQTSPRKPRVTGNDLAPERQPEEPPYIQLSQLRESQNEASLGKPNNGTRLSASASEIRQERSHVQPEPNPDLLPVGLVVPSNSQAPSLPRRASVPAINVLDPTSLGLNLPFFSSTSSTSLPVHQGTSTTLYPLQPGTSTSSYPAHSESTVEKVVYPATNQDQAGTPIKGITRPFSERQFISEFPRAIPEERSVKPEQEENMIYPFRDREDQVHTEAQEKDVKATIKSYAKRPKPNKISIPDVFRTDRDGN